MLAREVGGKELEGLALRALGDLCAETMWDTSNPEAEDEAITYFGRSLVIFRAIGSDYEVARTLHAYGNRLLERGDVEGGKAHLEEAKGIFQRIQSKTGDKITRTIEEVVAQAEGPQAPRKRSLMDSISPKKKAPEKKTEIPDMTADLETNEE
jgi:hypothetical protein